MDLHLDYVILLLLSLIINTQSVTTVLQFDESCTAGDYKSHTVSDSQSYDLIYEGINPPKLCRIIFYQGPDGEACVEATKYDIEDCGIEINFSSDTIRDYSCNDPPSGRTCTYPGGFLKIMLRKKYPRKQSYMYSSFKLHITQGNVNKDDSSGSLPITIILALIAAIVIVMVILLIIISRRRALQRRTMNSRYQTPSTQNIVMYHDVQQTPTLSNTPATGHNAHYNIPLSFPTASHTSSNGQNQEEVTQRYRQQSNQHTNQQHFDLNEPPPSYEDAKMYMI